MTALQKIQLRQSEVRQRLNVLLGLDTLTDEQKAELEKLSTEGQELEVRFRAANVAADPDPDPEPDPAKGDAAEKKLLELRAKAKVGDFVLAAVQGTGVSGASAEYAAERGVPGQIPYDLLRPPRRHRQSEHRAADGPGETRADEAMMPSPAGGSEVQHPILPEAFEPGIGAYLSVEMPEAEMGTNSYPLIKEGKGVASDIVGLGGSIESVSPDLELVSLSPRRLTGRVSLRREYLATVPMLEESMRENLGATLLNELENNILNGGGADDTMSGIVQQSEQPTAASALVTFDAAVGEMADQLDGLFGTELMDFRLVVNPTTAAKLAKLFRAAATVDGSGETFWTWAKKHLGEVRVSKRMPKGDSDVSLALVHRMAVPGRLAVAPTWGGVALIRDEISAASKGFINVTAIGLVGGVGILRRGAYQLVSFKTA